MQKFPSVGCKCYICETLRFQGIPDQTYVEWLMDKDNPYSISVDGYEIPVTVDYGVRYKEQPVEKNMVKDFSGTYRFNYSIVDEYGHGADYSVVLAVQTRPEDEFQEFMRLVANSVRWHLIEYFMVRWENGEYARV